MRCRRKVSLPVGLAFVASVLVHAAIAWLLLVPEAPSRTLGSAPGVAVVFELAGPGEGGDAPTGGSGADASPVGAAVADMPPAAPPAEPGEIAVEPPAAAIGTAAVPAPPAEPAPVAPAGAAPPADAPPVAPAAADPPDAPVASERLVEPEPVLVPDAAVPAPPSVTEVAPAASVPVPPVVQPVAAAPPPEPRTTAVAPRRKPVPPEPEPETAIAPVVAPAEIPAHVAQNAPLADAGKLAGIGGDAASAAEVATPGAQVAALTGLARGTIDARPGAAGGAATRPGGGDGPSDDFLARLQAWLERHKRYPRRARLRSEEGIVLVRFVLGGDGAVSGVELARSSGHALLDEEATALLARAQPLPRGRVAGVDGPLRLEVPIRFALR